MKRNVDNNAPHCVYRYYDADERLLYVGCTLDTHQRLHAHAAERDWFDQVAYAHFEHFAGEGARTQARARERVLIENLHPAYNVAFKAPECERRLKVADPGEAAA